MKSIVIIFGFLFYQSSGQNLVDTKTLEKSTTRAIFDNILDSTYTKNLLFPPWDSSTYYYYGDLVSYQGQNYVAELDEIIYAVTPSLSPNGEWKKTSQIPIQELVIENILIDNSTMDWLEFYKALRLRYLFSNDTLIYNNSDISSSKRRLKSGRRVIFRNCEFLKSIRFQNLSFDQGLKFENCKFNELEIDNVLISQLEINGGSIQFIGIDNSEIGVMSFLDFRGTPYSTYGINDNINPRIGLRESRFHVIHIWTPPDDLLLRIHDCVIAGDSTAFFTRNTQWTSQYFYPSSYSGKPIFQFGDNEDTVQKGAYSLEALRTSFGNNYDSTGVSLRGKFSKIVLDSCIVSSNLNFYGSTISERLHLTNNTFKGLFAINNVILPADMKIRWNQLAGYKISKFNRAEILHKLTGTYRLDQNFIPSKGAGLKDLNHYEDIIKSYQLLLGVYNSYGDAESSNGCDEEMENVQASRLHYLYTEEKTLKSFTAWRQKQIIIWYSQNRIAGTMILGVLAIGLVLGSIRMTRKKEKPTVANKRLAALVFSDIVGYTAMMGRDEKKTMKVLDVNRSVHLLFSRRFNGELLKEMGDGMLCSFSTASDAVKFCIDVQREIGHNKEFQLRMGVHLGEVVFSKGDVFGDGVNIASRLESEATDGGIYISDTVYQNIRNQTDIIAEFVGERELKNVVSKVKMYEVKY